MCRCYNDDCGVLTFALHPFHAHAQCNLHFINVMGVFLQHLWWKVVVASKIYLASSTSCNLSCCICCCWSQVILFESDTRNFYLWEAARLLLSSFRAFTNEFIKGTSVHKLFRIKFFFILLSFLNGDDRSNELISQTRPIKEDLK